MKKRLAILLALAMLISAFSIVSADAVNYGGELKAFGVIKGDQDGNLNADKNLTREEAIVTLIRMMGQEEKAVQFKGEQPFSDVPADNWSKPYLGYAKKQGWTNGIGEGKFGLGLNVTTQEYVTFMLRALGYAGSDVYNNAMTMGNNMNLLDGVSNDEAKASILRGDVFAVMYNTLYSKPAQSDKALVYKLGLAKEETPATEGKKTVYPLTIKNFNYAKEEIDVTFDKAPEKVFAVYQDSVETLLELGLEDRIVGCAGLDQDVKPQFAAAFAKVNYLTEFSPDKETVLAANPDMILSWFSYFGDKKMGDVDFWHERNVGTYMMSNSGATADKTVENEYKDILLIGKIFDVQDKAEKIVNDMKAEVEKVLAVANKMDQKPRVMVMEFDKKGVRLYGDNTLGGDMVKQIGAELVTAPDNRMTNEDLIVSNPDVIFTVYFGSSSSVEDEDKAIAALMEDPKFASLDAVKNKRVYAISLGEVYCSGTRTLDGIIKLAKGTYPDFEE